MRSTPDGIVVGRALVDAGDVVWLSPTHVRDWLETRPQDVVLTAEKWVNPDGTVTLKPKRVAKGTPVQTIVGSHIVFGESFEAASRLAQQELKKQALAVMKHRRQYWRHLCATALTRDLPTWIGTPRGEVCAHCGRKEKAGQQ
jgi:hypothetical protein